MILGRLWWYPLTHMREGAYADFEETLKDVKKFMAEHEPTINTDGIDVVLRNNFVSDQPTSVVLGLFFVHDTRKYWEGTDEDSGCHCKGPYVRCGHLWVSVDSWFGNPMLNVMQYQIDLPPNHAVPIEDKKALLHDIILWGKALGAMELRTVAYGDALKRAYRMFYGITNERNDYVIRKVI